MFFGFYSLAVLVPLILHGISDLADQSYNYLKDMCLYFIVVNDLN